ncbi:hypothetical protein H6H01_13115 [Nostoc calcicola FACHB-3891]|nr:hypothetical protein [Nostoc calcicola FACHB-3891]
MLLKKDIDLTSALVENRLYLLEYPIFRFQSIQQTVLVKGLSIPPPYSSKYLMTLTNPFSNPVAREAF